MIEILKYEKLIKGKIIGQVDVKIQKWGIIIRKINHFQDQEKKWFNFPAYAVVHPDGKYTYFPYVQFEASIINAKFFEQLSEAVKEYCEKHQQETQVAVDEVPF
jgi:hypothetical protein